MYRLESWSYISSKPIFILPLNVSNEELSEKIFNSLKHSRSITEDEEDSFWLGKGGLLKEFKEKSFNELYSKSVSCIISLNNEVLIIEPEKYLGKNKGLEVIMEEVEKTLYSKENELKITNLVIDKLKELE